MTWTKLILEFFQPIFWPLLVAGLGILFRKEITKLISRLTKIGREGIELAPPDKPLATKSPAAVDQIGSARTQVSIPFVQETANGLKIKLDEAQAKKHIDREQALLSALAESQWKVFFEQTYNIIWGSQLRFLHTLIGSDGEVPIDTAKNLFEAAKSIYPAYYSNYDFDGWLGFLRNSLLVGRDNDIVTITPQGRYFLDYIANRNYLFTKAG